jgi:hypothetical protein
MVYVSGANAWPGPKKCKATFQTGYGAHPATSYHVEPRTPCRPMAL